MFNLVDITRVNINIVNITLFSYNANIRNQIQYYKGRYCYNRFQKEAGCLVWMKMTRSARSYWV